jgi:hypothetical protein
VRPHIAFRAAVASTWLFASCAPYSAGTVTTVLGGQEVSPDTSAAYPVLLPSPRYPEILRQAGIAGQVEFTFMLDTLGHAMPGSIRVLSSTHDLFVAPARLALQQSTFAPFRVAGSPTPRRLMHAYRFIIVQPTANRAAVCTPAHSAETLSCAALDSLIVHRVHSSTSTHRVPN